MGREKGALPFGPETMLERVLRLVEGPTGTVVVSTAAGRTVPGPHRVAYDPTDDAGPLAGLLHAAALLDTEYVFVIACDMPLLQPALIPLLGTLSEDCDGAVPVVGGRRAVTCAIYRRAALLAVSSGFGDPAHRSLRSYVARLDVREVDETTLRSVDPHLQSFLPCNTPDEYQQALRLAGLPVNGQVPPAV